MRGSSRRPGHSSKSGVQCHGTAPTKVDAGPDSNIQKIASQAGLGAFKKVTMVSLGCAKNTVDGEVLLGDLSRSGFDITLDEDETTDAIVINTCAFVEEAKNESIEAILRATQMKAEGKTKKVIVTGCLGQRYNDTLAEELPEVDMIVGFENYGGLSNNLRASLDPNGSPISPFAGTDQLTGFPTAPAPINTSRVQVGSATVPFRSEWGRYRLTPNHTAYIRVAEGCDHACTFCAIPGFRGKFRSKPWASLLEEIKYMAESGVKEFNLIAEDTNQYGTDRRDDKNLARLLREMGKIEGVEWIRILYAYPSYFTDDLIQAIAEVPQVCKYIDIPLQHISNLTLLRMNRPPRKHTEDLLNKLRDRIPGLVLRTTFISGFPGETVEEHKELVKFIRKFKFERLGDFMFSEEDGTPAAQMDDQVDYDVREARRDEIVSIQQGISERFADTCVGKEMEVIVDRIEEDEEGGRTMIGRTRDSAPDVDPIVFISDPEDPSVPTAQVGEIRKMKISGAFLFDLEAYPIA